MLRHVDRFREHGALPEGGGTLDQSASFLAMLDQMGADMAAWELRLKIDRR